MKRTLIIGAFCALAVTGAAAALAAGKKPSDPVLMTVNGKEVRLSEFEYLYRKNNSQQSTPQSVDEYVDMFVTYKLKVADAEAAGIDTTAAFIKEYTGYRDELAVPYLADTQYEDSLMREAYSHYLQSVDVSHIMVPLADKNGNTAPQVQLIDSLRTLVAAGADFVDLARRYSSDQSARVNGGHLGWITMGQFPYEFEEVAYATPEGELSPVFATRFGHHFIKAGGRRDNPGEVHVRHILKLTRGLSPDEAAAKKAAADSIYQLLIGGADFAEVAKANSEDPGSARNGGELPWVSTGRMVPEFEQVAFGLADGVISEPFQTQFGWHIVQRLGHRGPSAFEDIKSDISKSMQRDVRQQRIADHQSARYRKLYPVVTDASAADAVISILKGQEDQDKKREALEVLYLNAATVGGRPVSVQEVVKLLTAAPVDPDRADEAYEAALRHVTDAEIMNQAREDLAATNAEYRNLTGEYRDGMLLFEISNREVWERASKDDEGLQRYFEANRNNYTWKVPHYKGYIVMTTADSTATAAREYLTGRSYEGLDSLNADLRRQFGKGIRADRVVTARGDNAIVDYVAFGGEKPAQQKGRRYSEWFAFDGRVIEAPEEAGDVRGAVSTDYQQQLEREWVEALHRRYPVKINKKVLKKVK